MRTITRTYEVYPLAELTANAQQEAYYDWLNTYDYGWGSDNRETLDAFCKVFGVICTNWGYDAYTYNFSYLTNHPGTIEELAGQRLATYITNNYWYALYPAKTYWKNSKKRKSRIFKDSSCPLTGYCFDDDILQPVYDFLRKPEETTDFMTLINRCLDHFFAVCRDDMADRESKDNFNEESELNEWEYLANGKLFS